MIRVGQGGDIHALVAGRKLIIGGVIIPHAVSYTHLDVYKRQLLGVRRFADDNLGQIFNRGHRLLIDRHNAKRGGEGFAERQGQPFDRNPVRRTEQDNALYDVAQGAERGVNAGGDRAGINIAGMRNNCLLYTSRCV